MAQPIAAESHTSRGMETFVKFNSFKLEERCMKRGCKELIIERNVPSQGVTV